MDRNNNLREKNIKAQSQIPVPYDSELHISPTNYHLLAAQQAPYENHNS